MPARSHDVIRIRFTDGQTVYDWPILSISQTVAIRILTAGGYTDEGIVEALFSDCLLLGEETMNALRGVPSVSDLALIPPATLEDFPHCQCQVVATVSMLTQFIPEDLL